MVEGKAFIVDMSESTVRGTWESPEQPARENNRLSMASRLSRALWGWGRRLGQLERRRRIP